MAVCPAPMSRSTWSLTQLRVYSMRLQTEPMTSLGSRWVQMKRASG